MGLTIWTPSGQLALGDSKRALEDDDDDEERVQALALEALRQGTFGRTPVSVCTIPVDEDGTMCQHPFFEGEERAKVQHLARCAGLHADAIAACHERMHPSILKPWDTEHAEWVDAHRDAILRGDTSAY